MSPDRPDTVLNSQLIVDLREVSCTNSSAFHEGYKESQASTKCRDSFVNSQRIVDLGGHLFVNVSVFYEGYTRSRKIPIFFEIPIRRIYLELIFSAPDTPR